MSNRLTFSLASLILIIAFGLVFGTTSVMAHNGNLASYVGDHDGKLNSDSTQDDPTEEDHSHLDPLTPALMLFDVKVTKKSTVKDSSVQLVDDVDGATPALTDLTAATAGQFAVKVTFTKPIYNTLDATTAAANDLISTELTVTAAAQSASGVNLFGGGVSVSSVARVTDDTDTTDVNESLSQFLITFEVAETLFGATDQLPIDVWVQVNQNALTTVDGGLVNGVAKFGRGNNMSARMKFTIVETLPVDPVAPDTTPPTVTPQDPKMQTDGTVDFVFTFDEALGTGFNDLEVSDFTITGGSTTTPPTITSAANVYTLSVTPATASSAVTVTLKANSVQNLAGLPGPATAVTRIYRPAAADTTPVFKTTTVANLPAGLCVGDKLPAGVTLPLADDNEGDTLEYTLTPALPAGLSWRTTDAQTRVIEGTATTAGTTTHTWTATDDSVTTGDPSKDSASITFSIVVKAHQKPTKPMVTVNAMKVDAASMVNTTMNRVELAWTAPTYDATYPKCIPAATSYTVYQRKLDEATGTFPLVTMTHTEYTASASAVVSTESAVKYTGATDSANAIHFGGTAAAPKFVSPELEPGIYEFAITATNVAGESPESNMAVWNTTGGMRVVVANVPAAPTDLRAAIHSGNNVTVNWLKVPDAADGGAPINDNSMAVRNKYYGVAGDFAGYVLYQVNQATFEVTRYPKTGTINPGMPEIAAGTVDTLTDIFYEHPTIRILNLPSGEYVFRVTAENIAGESLRSVSTPHAHVRVVAPTTPPPTTLPFGSVTAKYTEGNTTTTISAGMIKSNNFAVVYADALPDLELFFSQGGSITLMDPGAAPAKSVVISEILWGIDYGEPAASQKKHQFIELYNTNISGDIDLAGWKLVFTRGAPAPATDVDQVSNVAGAGWIVNVGQSGRIANTTLTGGTVTPTELISMYRDIKFAKVQNTDGGKIEERLKDFPNGNAAGSWLASTRVTTQTSIKSSPGRRHFKPFEPIKATEVKRDTFVINEIGNDTDGTSDWIELKNVSDSEQSLKNYQLSVVTGDHDMEYDKDKHKDTQLFHFHDKDLKVPAKGIVLIASTDPVNTDIAAGRNLEKSVDDQDPTGLGGDVIYIVRSFNLPDTGKTLLILRNNHETKHLGTEAHIKDVVGTLKIKLTSTGTSLWPLKATGAPNGNVIDGTDDEDFRAGKVYKRNNAGSGTGEKDFGTVGYTGIGYDRVAADSAVNGGTPGYANDTLKEFKDAKTDKESDAPVTITEIMLDVGEGRQNLPQWIELYNSSLTEAVTINGWKLIIENNDDPEEPAVTVDDATLTFGNVRIQPNQTILIVSTSGRTSDPDHFPATRVINLWTTKAHRDALEMTRRTDQVFSASGFYFKLIDKGNNVVDEVGNLDGNRRTRDEPAWALPMSQEEDRRSSLMRVHDRGVAEDGMTAAGWIRSDSTSLAYTISETYYGDPDDSGSPGFRAGGPLPVSLSKFRPERMKDTGEIVVRWVTESELNNAGFNILRSETRNGAFKQINTELIAGKGTTSERHTYEWKDTTAKPNVVYYYQIQDVSLDGEVTTLRLSRLKGNVTAAGKATTTWGEIKALQ